MLNTEVNEISMEDGKATGIKSGSEGAKAPIVICDPSYAPESMLKPCGQVIRAICLLNHPIPDTKDVPSCQIIIPAKQLGRQSGKYFKYSDVFRHLYFHGLLRPFDLRQGLLCCYGLDHG